MSERRGEVEKISIRVREKELYPQESSLARKERRELRSAVAPKGGGGVAVHRGKQS